MFTDLYHISSIFHFSNLQLCIKSVYSYHIYNLLVVFIFFNISNILKPVHGIILCDVGMLHYPNISTLEYQPVQYFKAMQIMFSTQVSLPCSEHLPQLLR